MREWAGAAHAEYRLVKSLAESGKHALQHFTCPLTNPSDAPWSANSSPARSGLLGQPATACAWQARKAAVTTTQRSSREWSELPRSPPRDEVSTTTVPLSYCDITESPHYGPTPVAANAKDQPQQVSEISVLITLMRLPWVPVHRTSMAGTRLPNWTAAKRCATSELYLMRRFPTVRRCQPRCETGLFFSL